MSEYWKSTPKYWCKHCKAFVRDTKLERTNHEATPKHQGNIKRFIRDLHRGHEREERDQQRAKDEVNRLNGVVTGSKSSSTESNVPPWQRKAAIPQVREGARQATPAERKQQLSQLAAMGVAVPEDFRREMAMAGDWQTLSEKPVDDDVKKEQDPKDTKSFYSDAKGQTLNFGIRKRKYEGQDEEEEAENRVAKKGWGSTARAYPPTKEDIDLEILLDVSRDKSKGPRDDTLADLSNNEQGVDKGRSDATNGETAPSIPIIKKEDSDSATASRDILSSTDASTSLLTSKEEPVAEPVFKKRKPKNIRQK